MLTNANIKFEKVHISNFTLNIYKHSRKELSVILNFGHLFLSIFIFFDIKLKMEVF